MGISHKNILFGSEARAALKKGVDTLAKAVSVTLGGKGRNVVIDKELSNKPIITKDGVTVAKEIELQNKEENTGVRMARESSLKTNSVAGDGTTTSIVLTQAIFSEGYEYMESKDSNSSLKNPIDISRGMNIAKNIVHEYLTNVRREIGSGVKEIEQIATVSANNDNEIGKIISEAITKVTKDGVVVVELSKDISTKVDIKTGMQYDKGWASPFFVTDQKSMVYEAEKPIIFLFNRNLSSIREILNLLEGCVNSSRSNIVLIAHDFTGDVIPSLVQNKINGVINCVCIKAPSYGEQRYEILKDIAASIGCEVITDELLESKNAQIQQIGKIGSQNPQLPPVKLDLKMFAGEAEKIIVEQNKFTIINGNGSKEKIEERLEVINHLLEKDDVESATKDDLRRRKSRFVGGIAQIKVGAATEQEAKEKKDRYDDAMSATKAALDEGIIPGGGTQFIHASLLLEKRKEEVFKNMNDTQQKKDMMAGYDIVLRAIQYPFKLIVNNAGINGEELLKEYIKNHSSNPNIGYDVIQEKFVDMYESGIIDPVKVAKTALENSISSASMLLTTDCILEEEIEPEIKMKMLDPTQGF